MPYALGAQELGPGGPIRRGAGPRPEARNTVAIYSAADPQLMLWVHATLVETSLAVVQRFAGALTEAEREAYYREMGVVVRLFGAPPTTIPRTFADFREYLAAQLGGPEIVVTAPARDVAGAILRAPLPAHCERRCRRTGSRRRRSCPSACGEYGLRWSAAHAAALELSARPLRLAAMALLRAAERVAPSPSLELPVRSPERPSGVPSTRQRRGPGSPRAAVRLRCSSVREGGLGWPTRCEASSTTT